jgi:hypothetical protein
MKYAFTERRRISYIQDLGLLLNKVYIGSVWFSFFLINFSENLAVQRIWLCEEFGCSKNLAVGENLSIITITCGER